MFLRSAPIILQNTMQKIVDL